MRESEPLPRSIASRNTPAVAAILVAVALAVGGKVAQTISRVSAQEGGAMGNTIGPVNSPTPAAKGSHALFKAETAPPSAAPVRSAGTADVQSLSETTELVGQKRVFEYFTKGLGRFRVTLTPAPNGMTKYEVDPIDATSGFVKNSGDLSHKFPSRGLTKEEVEKVVFAALTAGMGKRKFMHRRFVERGWETLEEKPK